MSSWNKWRRRWKALACKHNGRMDGCVTWYGVIKTNVHSPWQNISTAQYRIKHTVYWFLLFSVVGNFSLFAWPPPHFFFTKHSSCGDRCSGQSNDWHITHTQKGAVQRKVWQQFFSIIFKADRKRKIKVKKKDRERTQALYTLEKTS